MSPRASKNQEPGFEQAMKRLEEISARMDDPETGLEETIALVEEGFSLVRRCRKLLNEAELRIKTLENPDAAASPATPAAASPAPGSCGAPSPVDDGFTLL